MSSELGAQAKAMDWVNAYATDLAEDGMDFPTEVDHWLKAVRPFFADRAVEGLGRVLPNEEYTILTVIDRALGERA